MTHTRTEIGALLAAHDLEPSRALGQNFVVDPNTVRRIARLATVDGDTPVVEVGAGLGSLTLALAETGAPVLAVERDRHLVPVLRAVTTDLDQVEVVEADALELDWGKLLRNHAEWVLVANLPYNVATPLILDLLREVPVIRRMLVMVQLEAGERLAAGPGSRTYGIPSVKVALHGEARIVGRVGPDVFLPRPRVDSALVEIVRHASPVTEADHAGLVALVEQAFGQRRKMLRRSLSGTVDAAMFEVAGIDPTDRPELLSVEAWGQLALAVAGSR